VPTVVTCKLELWASAGQATSVERCPTWGGHCTDQNTTHWNWSATFYFWCKPIPLLISISII